MSADVLSFPIIGSAAHADTARRSVAGTRRQYRFSDVVRLLAMQALEPRTQVEQLRRLHRQAGFPAPLNPRFYAGQLQRGADAIHRGSVWCAVAVDDWRDAQDRPPPSADALRPPPLPQSRRVAMREAARALGQG